MVGIIRESLPITMINENLRQESGFTYREFTAWLKSLKNKQGTDIFWLIIKVNTTIHSPIFFKQTLLFASITLLLTTSQKACSCCYLAKNILQLHKWSNKTNGKYRMLCSSISRILFKIGPCKYRHANAREFSKSPQTN